MAEKTRSRSRRRGRYNNFLKATPEMLAEGSFLAVSSVVCHLAGMILRIYSTNIYGDMGSNYFACAYDIYLVVLILTSYCLPGTVAGMVSTALENRHPTRAFRIFQAGLIFAFVIGAVAAGLLYLCSSFLARTVMATPYSVFALRLLCIAVFTNAINGVLRGFFQGMGTYTPTGVSQLVEQVVKVIVGIASCTMLYDYGTTVGTVLADIPHYSAAFAATSISYGVVVGSVFSILVCVIFMMATLRGLKRLMAKDHKKIRESFLSMIGSIFLTMMPLMFAVLLPNASTALTQGVFKKIGDLQGYTQDNLAVWWGIYAGKYKLMLALPIAVGFAAAMSNAGKMLEKYQDGDGAGMHKEINKGIRYTMVASIPELVWLGLFMDHTIACLYPGTSSTQELSVKICLLGLIGIVLYGYFAVTTVYLQILGRIGEFIQNAVFAVVIEVVMMILLMLFARLNIYAVVISGLAFALIMCFLNFASLFGNFGFHQELLYTILIPTGLSVVVTAISFGIYYLFYNSTENNTASVLVAFFAAAGIYTILVFFSKCIKPEDLEDSKFGQSVLHVLQVMHIF